jgi:ATP-binding cassette subfamily B protein
MKIRARVISEAISSAGEDPSWRSIALLDAALRMLDPMMRERAFGGSRSRARILKQFLSRARESNPFAVVPPTWWSVLPAQSPDGEEEQLVFRGAVVVRVCGKKRAARHAGEAEHRPELLRQRPVKALREVLRLLRADGLLTPSALACAVLLSAGGVLLEALLYRTFLDLPAMLGLPEQRLTAIVLLAGFLTALLLLDLYSARGVLRAGRRLEVRLRARLLYALPRLADRYFGSRLVSDMAERSHAIHEIRAVPLLASQFLGASAGLLLTIAGIGWLDGAAIGPAVACALASISLPLVTQPLLAERDLRFRTHTGGLCRFYLDSLRGLMPARAHSAENAIRSEHEDLLVSWNQAGMALLRIAVALDSVGVLLNVALVAWVVVGHISRHRGSAVALLLVYWALNLPALGNQVARIAWQYPKQRNLARRLLEPLGAAGDDAPENADPPPPRADSRASGASILFDRVTVRAIGHTIVEDCTLRIAAGSHVCIVGPSGAGKSTLVGVLLGWHSPSSGLVLVDGEPLDTARLESLRRETAWVDSSTQIWNRSLLENLQYGSSPGRQGAPIGRVLELAGLMPVLERLPDGMRTVLGESGALVSGGEGQRVRLGRAMMREKPRLVILDEAFTNLDRSQRRALLRRAREIWKEATLLAITHDVAEARHFDRVLVVEAGRVVEDGRPDQLARRTDSRFKQLLDVARDAEEHVWAGPMWRKLRVDRGRVIETKANHHDQRVTEIVLAGRATGRRPGGVVPDLEDPDCEPGGDSSAPVDS